MVRVRLLLTTALLLLASTLACAYTLGPSDHVTIQIRTEQTQLSLDTTVSIDGRVYVSPAGDFVAEGKTPAQLEAEIKQGLSKYYVGEVKVTVLLMTPKDFPVSVLGQVKQPGVYRLVDDRPQLSTAIFKAGGLLPQASTRRVSVTRGGRELGPVDLYAVLSLGRSDLDLTLCSDDVVYVPARERWATVMGPVEQPGVYELLPSDRVSNAIRLAGGMTAAADPRRAVIERSDAAGHPQTIAINPQAALTSPGGDVDPPLANGDTVRLATRIAQVYVVGEVSEPGAKDFQDNRSLLDYIGLSGGLTSRAKPSSAGVIRPGNPEPKITPVDLTTLMQGRAKSPPPQIAPGDIIVIPGRRIATVQDWGSLGQVLTGIVAGIRIF